jgi:GT2 family glycosyltransferase
MLKSFKNWNRRRLDARRAGKQTPTYREWIKNNHRAPLKGGKLACSFLIPVHPKTTETCLALIESLRSQNLPPHQVVLFAANDEAESTLAKIKASASENLALIFAPAQHGQQIMARLWAASKLCNGQWTCVATAAGSYATDAIAWVSHAITQAPSLKFIYADEDELNRDGERINPFFKPDLNRELLLSGDHLGSPVFIEHDALLKCLSTHEKQPLASPYHLYLRCLASLRDHEVGHIPMILFHGHFAKKAVASQQKASAHQHVATAVELFLHEQNTACRVVANPLSGVIRTFWPLPESPPLVSIVVPTRNGQALVRQLITSLAELTTYKNYEILLVDNNSDDPLAIEYFDSLNARGLVTLIKDPGEFNYSRINNGAVRQARGEFVLLLNNDIEVLRPDWLTEMVSHAARPGVGCVGARLLYPDDTLQHAGVVVGLGGLAGHVFCGLPAEHGGYFNRAQSTQEFSAVTAACLLIRRSVFEAVGGLDEELFAVAFNDVDLCLKVREAGYRNIYTPHALLRHHESATRGPDTSGEKLQRFKKEGNALRQKWGDTLMIDPMYNPNLALNTGHFAIADQSRPWTLARTSSN